MDVNKLPAGPDELEPLAGLRAAERVGKRQQRETPSLKSGHTALMVVCSVDVSFLLGCLGRTSGAW